MIFERTSYRPHPGAFDEVLKTRLTACNIRKELGLRAGEILTETLPETGEKLVHWECQFATEADQQADLATRGDSAEFKQIRKQMNGLVDSFERRVFEHASVQASVLRSVTLEDHQIVPKEVTFRSGNLELTGFLYLPPGEGPFPCMVTNHGSSISQGTTDICRPGSAALLMSWGIASFLPHRRGYGNSPGSGWRVDVSADYGTKEYDNQLEKRLDDESEDVIAALEFLETLPEIDRQHIGVMGSSFGGTVTLFAASKCPRFRCAVEFAGAAMNWEKAPGLRSAMLAAAQKVAQPIYFIQAENDYSAQPTRELAASLEGSNKIHRSKVFPGFGISKDEGHFFHRDGGVIWGSEVRGFLDRWL